VLLLVANIDDDDYDDDDTVPCGICATMGR
jgi:hypothetical protein